MSVRSLMTHQPPHPAMTPAFTDSLIYTQDIQTQEKQPERGFTWGEMGQVTASQHGETNPVACVKRDAELSSLMWSHDRNTTVLTVLLFYSSSWKKPERLLIFKGLGVQAKEYVVRLCVCVFKYLFCDTVWDELCSQPCKECGQRVHPPINLSNNPLLSGVERKHHISNLHFRVKAHIWCYYISSLDYNCCTSLRLDICSHM